MNELLEQIKGYLNAFEAINDGNDEGPDYLVDEVEFDSDVDELISIENYLMRVCNSNKKPETLRFERINNWQESLEVIFKNYFTRNVKLNTDLYKIKFIEMLNKYINSEHFEVLGSGVDHCFSSIAEYFGEVSGSDIIFIFNKKILILHFGIND
jgi:hypothetical protein